jgi:hypothetical protein
MPYNTDILLTQQRGRLREQGIHYPTLAIFTLYQSKHYFVKLYLSPKAYRALVNASIGGFTSPAPI